MDWVAVASVVSSAGVAIYTVWQTTLNAARDREHDREMAQEARRQERRGTTYVEVLTALHHLMTAIDRTSPILVVGKPPDPPPPPGDPELWRLNALTAAFASRDVQQMVREWTRKQNEFYAAVWYLREVQQDRGPTSDDTKRRYGVTDSEQWQKVEAFRQDLRDRMDAIGEKVNQELDLERAARP